MMTETMMNGEKEIATANTSKNAACSTVAVFAAAAHVRDASEVVLEVHLTLLTLVLAATGQKQRDRRTFGSRNWLSPATRANS